jgi:hypothetical protein
VADGPWSVWTKPLHCGKRMRRCLRRYFLGLGKPAEGFVSGDAAEYERTDRQFLSVNPDCQEGLHDGVTMVRMRAIVIRMR